MADLGPMKGQYRQKLVELLDGKPAARLLERGYRPAGPRPPYYLDDEEKPLT